jgi:hypothetical protein
MPKIGNQVRAQIPPAGPRGRQKGAAGARDQEYVFIPVQKCCFIGCHNQGIPSEGFDFFACVDCLDELGQLLMMQAQFHQACFQKIVFFRSGIATG